MSRSFRVITLGCKVNQYESAYLKESLMRRGWRQAVPGEPAGCTVVNTCVVTQRAAHQSRQAIRKAVRDNPSGRVAVVGCYPQVLPQELWEIEGVDMVAGNRVKAQLPRLLAESRWDEQDPEQDRFIPGMGFEPMRIDRYPDRRRAHLKVQDGCEAACTYCIVPLARGPCRSLPPDEVLSGIEGLAAQGCREIVLTGIHLGHYGVDLGSGMGLSGLLRRIGGLGLPVRIRLSSIEPLEIDSHLIDLVADHPWMCRHFHVPLQSGDNAILRRMNRHYTVETYRSLVFQIRQRVPDAAIGADVLAGFPGEDGSAHLRTCRLLEELPVSYLHVFPFSPRPGTPAASFAGQVAPSVIKGRARDLREIGHSKRDGFYRAMINTTQEVLGERRQGEFIEGTSGNYVTVVLPAPPSLEGRLIPVRITSVAGGKARGEIPAST